MGSVAAWSIQATHLYLPRSMARMGPAAVVTAVVVICKLRVGGRRQVWQLHVTTPRLALVRSAAGEGRVVKRVIGGLAAVVMVALLGLKLAAHLGYLGAPDKEQLGAESI